MCGFGGSSDAVFHGGHAQIDVEAEEEERQ